MSDDIETLSGIDRMTARITELTADRDRLQRCAVQGQEMAKEQMDRCIAAERDRDRLQRLLDDRHADDVKAWKAIMRATGKERGIPPNKEVVAYLVAEVDRLEKEAEGWKQLYETEKESAEAVDLDNISLRAKLDRAKEALRTINELQAGEPYRITVRAMKDIALDALTELSADAPVQQMRITQPAALTTAGSEPIGPA